MVFTLSLAGAGNSSFSLGSCPDEGTAGAFELEMVVLSEFFCV